MPLTVSTREVEVEIGCLLFRCCLGWQIARQRGSHIVLTKPGASVTLSVPDHPQVARGCFDACFCCGAGACPVLVLGHRRFLCPTAIIALPSGKEVRVNTFDGSGVHSDRMHGPCSLHARFQHSRAQCHALLRVLPFRASSLRWGSPNPSDPASDFAPRPVGAGASRRHPRAACGNLLRSRSSRLLTSSF
jgi:hypothetical protein